MPRMPAGCLSAAVTMEVLPFRCPRHGHEFRRLDAEEHECLYACPSGQVKFSTSTLAYIDPKQDKDGTRAKIALELIEEAWSRGDMSPYLHSVVFDRRLAEQEKKPNLWECLFGRRSQTV